MATIRPQTTSVEGRPASQKLIGRTDWLDVVSDLAHRCAG